MNWYVQQNREHVKNALLSGAWAKIGRGHYRHASGAEVRRNCNTRHWEVLNAPPAAGRAWQACWVAMEAVERHCPSGFEVPA